MAKKRRSKICSKGSRWRIYGCCGTGFIDDLNEKFSSDKNCIN